MELSDKQLCVIQDKLTAAKTPEEIIAIRKELGMIFSQRMLCSC